MKTPEWRAGSGFLFRPWVIAGLAVGITVVVVLAVSMLPWDEETVVPNGHLPVVRYISMWDREWGETLALSIDASGSIWSGMERTRDVRKTLRAFHRSSRRAWTEDGFHFVSIGEVVIRAHRRSRWADLRRVLLALVESEFTGVTLACKRRESWGAVTYMYVELWDVPRPSMPFEEEGSGPADEEREPNRLDVRSLDIDVAERGRDRLAADRKAAGKGDFVEPTINVVFLSDADAQSVFSVLECYVDGQGNTLRLSGLR